MARFPTAALLFVLADSGSAFTPPESRPRRVTTDPQKLTLVAEAEAPTRISRKADASTSQPRSPPSTSAGGERRKILKEPALWEYNFGLQDPGLALPHGIRPRVTAPEQFEIAEEQIRKLEVDGVVHIKGVFDAEWVEYLRAATAHQVDNPHFWAFAGTASKLYDCIQVSEDPGQVVRVKSFAPLDFWDGGTSGSLLLRRMGC